MPVEIQKATTFFLTMDAPEHTRYRRLISMAFTPKQVRKIEEQIKANAARIVGAELLAALDGGQPVDFMEVVAKKLPMQTVSEMIGLPKDQPETVAAAAEAVFGTSDDEVGGNLEEKAVFLMMQLGVLTNAGVELAKDRRVNPQDDLMTNIVQAEVDGHSLTDEEVGAFMVLLASADNDTTKQTTAHAFKALLDHPDQLAWLRETSTAGSAAPSRRIRPAGVPRHAVHPHRHRDTELAGPPRSARRQGRDLLLLRQLRRRNLRQPRVFNLDPGFPTSTSVSVAAAPRFTASASNSPSSNSNTCLPNSSPRIPDVEFVGDVDYIYSDFTHGIKHMTIRKR